MAGNVIAEEIGDLLSPYAARAEACLQRWLVEPGTPAALAEAMRYCVLGGGKRLRPAVVWLAAEAVGDGTPAATARPPQPPSPLAEPTSPEPDDPADRAAVAVELVHCYSLVHDDLPAMDDDALRRGRPTAHVRFGQAMAILAGDALLTRAFGVLARAPADLAGTLAAELACGAGATGMIAGQVADMGLCQVPDGIEGLRFIHARKTAALFRAAARMGALCGRADPAGLEAVSRWAYAAGLAFQLVDDLLDATASAGQLGKTPGKDAGAGKRSAPAVLGMAGGARLRDELTAEAEAALAPLGARADRLRRLARLLARRTH